MRRPLLIAVLSAGLVAACASMTQDRSMSFFVTSANPGRGGDLGGLAGADAWCKQLASLVGHPNKEWRAYLSTEPAGAQGPVHARDRIGKGPWYNVKGDIIANNVAELHGNNNLNKLTALTEKGQLVTGKGETPLRHDILTGSAADGRAVGGATCNNWTASSGSSAMVGHHDRDGINPDPVANVSWNASHKTAGCSLAELARTGSAGYFYCFAAR